MAIVRCARLVWLFSFMLDVTAAEDTTKPLAPAPQVMRTA
jgi:hypothetical protein